MAASFYKSKLRSGDEVTLNFDCPWCGNQQSTQALPITVGSRSTWLVVICVSPPCRKPTLARIPLRGSIPWDVLDTTLSGMEHEYGEPELHPTSSPTYAPEGVPPSIARDFQEALRCHAARFPYGAALVGRRVLQAAVRDKGGTGKNLKEEIDSLPTDVLNRPLKDSAHEVRFVGNDAAHADDVTPTDVADLLDFTTDVLDALYVVPSRIAARKKSRQP